ncbi:MAG: permease [Candidatus Hydrogenedentes bacterium]|nr:permease [Candidatus Hydrogenedentota bacterium]
MDWKKEWKTLAWIVAAFLACFYLPIGWARFDHAVMESLHLVKWYAREHVMLCLVPAFFIAGAIAVFISQAAVMKYLGANAPKLLAYGVASVSGTILAVCSCTVLPLFMGIYRMGAGLGPATAFLYSGPAINVLAIVLTARVLGLQMGVARAVGAVTFSVIIGLAMHWIFRKEELEKAKVAASLPEPDAVRPLWQNVLYFGSMVAILVFANWGKPSQEVGLWYTIYAWKWGITAACAVGLGAILVAWFHVRWWKMAATGLVMAGFAMTFPHEPIIPFTAAVIAFSILANTDNDEMQTWFASTWTFAKQILPLLLFGVLAAGFLLGRPGEEGLIPNAWIVQLVGGNSLWSNLFASVVGAFMYFATLTEVPILQGLMGSGMGKGPALALLLAGPALSLPSMLVIRGVLGTKKTVVYVGLVIAMATISGLLFGMIAG